MNADEGDFIHGELTELEACATFPVPAHRIYFTGLGIHGEGTITVEWEHAPGPVITTLVGMATAALLHECTHDAEAGE